MTTETTPGYRKLSSDEIFDAFMEIVQQRDELLAALKMMNDEFKRLPHSLGYYITHTQKIDELIAKVEAGK